MSAPEGSEHGQSADRSADEAPAAGGESVLANLPRKRPQRASPRRAAARRSGAAGNGTVSAAEQASPAAARSGAKAAAKPRRRKASTAAKGQARSSRGRAGAGTAARSEPRRSRARDPIPRQGFESDGEGLRGAVHPPGGAELFASAVEIVGELTKSGVASGERLVKDLLSRLSPS